MSRRVQGKPPVSRWWPVNCQVRLTHPAWAGCLARVVDHRRKGGTLKEYVLDVGEGLIFLSSDHLEQIEQIE